MDVFTISVKVIMVLYVLLMDSVFAVIIIRL